MATVAASIPKKVIKVPLLSSYAINFIIKLGFLLVQYLISVFYFNAIPTLSL